MRLPLPDLVRAALMAAAMAALSVVPPLRLPFSPVVITLQNLGVMVAGSLLPPRAAFLALALFLGLVAVGLPVLSGGRGGLGYILGPSGGYLLSWPLAAYAIARWTYGKPPALARFLAANVVAGIGLVYACGVPVLAGVTGMDPKRALWAGAAIFLPGDLLKAVAASLLGYHVLRRYPRLRYGLAGASLPGPEGTPPGATARTRSPG